MAFFMMIRNDVPRNAIEISSSGYHERRDLRRRLPRSMPHVRASFVEERMTNVWRVKVDRTVVGPSDTSTTLCWDWNVTAVLVIHPDGHSKRLSLMRYLENVDKRLGQCRSHLPVSALASSFPIFCVCQRSFSLLDEDILLHNRG